MKSYEVTTKYGHFTIRYEIGHLTIQLTMQLTSKLDTITQISTQSTTHSNSTHPCTTHHLAIPPYSMFIQQNLMMAMYTQIYIIIMVHSDFITYLLMLVFCHDYVHWKHKYLQCSKFLWKTSIGGCLVLKSNAPLVRGWQLFQTSKPKYSDLSNM